jgi:hypothetical protein
LRTVLDQALRFPDGVRSCREDLADDAVDGVVEAVGDLVHETDAKCRLGIEALAREEVASRVRADLGQHERRDHGGDDPELHFREPECRVGRGDRDVGTPDEAGAAAERVALHPGDDWCRAAVDRLAHPVKAHRVLDVLLEGKVDRCALPLHVGAGAEAFSLAGEHDGPRIADVGERFGELADQNCVEGVAPFRARDRHVQDVSVAFGSQRAHGLSLEFSACCEVRLPLL